jgi:hypothetical protein
MAAKSNTGILYQVGLLVALAFVFWKVVLPLLTKKANAASVGGGAAANGGGASYNPDNPSDPYGTSYAPPTNPLQNLLNSLLGGPSGGPPKTSGASASLPTPGGPGAGGLGAIATNGLTPEEILFNVLSSGDQANADFAASSDNNASNDQAAIDAINNVGPLDYVTPAGGWATMTNIPTQDLPNPNVGGDAGSGYASVSGDTTGSNGIASDGSTNSADSGSGIATVGDTTDGAGVDAGSAGFDPYGTSADSGYSSGDYNSGD